MKKQLDGFVAMMPFIQPGTQGWDWFGASLAQTVNDKLLMAGLTVIPFFELGRLEAWPEVGLLTNWEEFSLMSDFVENGYILAGSHFFNEKRVKINIFVVKPTGLSLVAKEDETKENFMRVIDHVCHEIAAAFGKPTNAKMRERIQATTSTTSKEAFGALVSAFDAWKSKDLDGVRRAVGQAKEMDPEYLAPLDLLVRATKELGSGSELAAAQRAFLTQAMASPTRYQALALVDELLAEAQRSGNNALAADCLKTRSAIQGNTDEDSIAQVFARRVQELDGALTALLREDEIGHLRILRKNGWSTGQVVALYLMAQSWVDQTDAALQAGQRAIASFYADRAIGLYRILGNAKKRRRVKEMLVEAKAALTT